MAKEKRKRRKRIKQILLGRKKTEMKKINRKEQKVT
jgi:hypothetical protein